MSGVVAAPLAVDARVSFTVGGAGRTFSVDAELCLEAGVLALFGPSGAGKTLTLEALAGLREVQEGHVRVQGQIFVDTAQGVCLPPHRRGVGYVPQHQALFPFLDVAANVGFGLPRGERRGPRVVRLLQELGIAHLSSAPPASLSGGERQRVALARALAVEPRLLLLDEPFASLDGAAAATLRVLVSEVVRRHNIPTLLVTHDADEAVAMGDRVVRFEAGRTVEAGRPAEVLARGEVTVRGRIERVEVEGGVARAELRDAVVAGAVGALREGAVEVQGQVTRGRSGASGTIA